MKIGVVINCGGEFKFLLTLLAILCSLATLSQLVTFPFCFSTTNNMNSLDYSVPTRDFSSAAVTSGRRKQELVDNGVVRRVFDPFGSAAYSFIKMGAYRGGLNNFAIVGLSSKPLHLYSKPTYLCEWVPNSDSAFFNYNAKNVTTVGYKILPDWGCNQGYGRVYTTVVVNCTFPQSNVNGGKGGKLFLHASTSGGGDRNFDITDTFEVLSEHPASVDLSLYAGLKTPKYDYLYCGSPLYGNLSPQRVREWIAYHVRLFGERSHFVLHDAGGVHMEVMRVLRPWIKLGYVTLQDIGDHDRFDSYYHNQFMVINDCLHRYKFLAKWIFFFDVDEYIYVPPKYTIKSVLDSLSNYTQFTIEQMPMSHNLCLSADFGRFDRKWGFEKLVYRDVKRGMRRDRKYAVQPRNVYATGVHSSYNIAGNTTHAAGEKIKYFHYHGAIAQRTEPCRQLLNVTQTNIGNNSYDLDTTMRDIVLSVKKFELKMIGPALLQTPQ